MGKIACLKKLTIFEELCQEELENVASFSRKQFLQPGEFLFNEDEPIESIHIVTDGRLKLSKFSIDGKELTLGFAVNDTVFGEEALFSDERYSMNAEAVEESCITSCSKEDMENLFIEKPKIAVKVIRSLSQKLSQSNQQLSDLAFRNVRERLLSTLQRLAENYGHQTNKGWQLDIKLTHNDLASIINASRVTVTQTMSKLREEGVVSVTDREILLKEKEIS